eukprot:TRINITY_DN3214_c0_g1_i1.p1 TRINITY_DN3214_c0_g1~~TRINITY_DN3214_c0_g1_i1.p1  ORF type:complete len:837 (-),score=230.35 TRINITY_DN3214_c0_g1_i1:46-2391(-)
MDALKHASNMISELRTGLLTPRSYYALYILTFDHLRHLEMYIADGGHGRPLHELYELVQYAGNILPRLYLLITVGSVYIKSLQAPAKEFLYDLVELCRGVQHPTRGLFLRNYLSEMTKDKLPDEGSKYEGEVTDSIDFIIANFTEMNKLWVRLQHGGSEVEKRKREAEREELHILVGKNLSRLSLLEGLTIGLYKSDVLPRILQQIIQCRDRIAQHHLMVILIQAFSDDFHLRTLDQLLEGISKLVEEVDVHIIISSLIDRLSSYFSSVPESKPSDINMFDLFEKYSKNIVKERTSSMKLSAVISLCSALLKLALRCYKDQLNYVDQVFDFAASVMEEKGSSSISGSVKEIVSLLQTVPTYFKNISPVLRLKNFNKVLSLLPPSNRREVGLFLIENALTNETEISVTEEVGSLFQYLNSIIKREANVDDSEWADDQTKISYIIGKLSNKSDVENMYSILIKAKELLSEPGVCVAVKFTLVPLVFKSLGLINQIYKNKDTDVDSWEKKCKLVFKFANESLLLIKQANEYSLAFNLYIQCTIAASRCDLGKFAYGFFTQGALAVYEDESKPQSQAEFDAVRIMIGTLNEITCFDKEKYELLAKRLTQHSSKLVVIEYQSRALLLSAYLFVSKTVMGETYNDTALALSCLKKSFSISNDVHDYYTKASLYVEILEHYVCFFEKYPQVAEAMYLNAIIQKIKKHKESGGDKSSSSSTSSTSNEKSHSSVLHYKNIHDYITSKQLPETYTKKVAKDDNNNNNNTKVKTLSDSEAKTEAERWKAIEV